MEIFNEINIGRVLSGKELNKLNNHELFYKFIDKEKRYNENESTVEYIRKHKDIQIIPNNISTNEISELTEENMNKFNKQYDDMIKKEQEKYIFQYKQGLNIDTNKFSTKKCSKGGLYFTTKSNIFKFINFGDNYCEIMIPDDATCSIEDYKIKANKIIIMSFIKINELDEWYNDVFCEQALKQNGKVIEYVKNQTKNMWKLAIEQNAESIKYIPNKTNEIYEFLAQQTGSIIKYIPDKLLTERICELAVQQDGFSIIYIPKEMRTQKIYELAVQQSANALYFVPQKFLTKEICESAIRQNPYMLCNVPIKLQTETMYELAVKQNGRALYCVPVEMRTEKICNLAIQQNIFAYKYIPKLVPEKKIIIHIAKEIKKIQKKIHDTQVKKAHEQVNMIEQQKIEKRIKKNMEIDEINRLIHQKKYMKNIISILNNKYNR